MTFRVAGSGQAELPEQLDGAGLDEPAARWHSLPTISRFSEPGQVLVDGGELPGEPDEPAHGARILDDVVAHDGGRAGVGSQNGRQDADRSGLAGAVRSEQTDDLAGRHVEVEGHRGP